MNSLLFTVRLDPMRLCCSLNLVGLEWPGTGLRLGHGSGKLSMLAAILYSHTRGSAGLFTVVQCVSLLNL